MTWLDELVVWLRAVGMSVEHFPTLPVYRLHRENLPFTQDLHDNVGT